MPKRNADPTPEEFDQASTLFKELARQLIIDRGVHPIAVFAACQNTGGIALSSLVKVEAIDEVVESAMECLRSQVIDLTAEREKALKLNS